MHVRGFVMADYDRVVELWREAGLFSLQSSYRPVIEHKLERDADLFLVAEQDGDIIGVVLGAFDGRWGWVSHLAIVPDRQRIGLGTLLMAELEDRLRAKGCVKVNLLIKPDNDGVQAFYEELGYARDDLIFMEKPLA